MNTYRHILVHVSDSDRSTHVLAFATALATAQGARLRAVHGVTVLYGGAYLTAESAMVSVSFDADLERQRVAKAQERVLDAARMSGLDIDFESPGRDPVEALVAQSRVADLVIVGQPSGDDAQGASRHFASQLLVAAGCPVLFVPAAGRVTRCGTRALVAWSNTRESARALRDALPLLQRAAAVEVMRVGAAQAGGPEPLDGVVEYLRAQGVSATAKVTAVRQLGFGERMLTPAVVDAPVAELLLSHAADMNADLLVMGGYGHTRAHELVLGGVTRTLLASMTVPALMSH